MQIKAVIQRSIDYIEENIRADITVDELCAMAGYSRVHYCRLFSLYTGLTPAEYIIRRKLLYAAYDLSNKMSKTDAAFSCGFDTYAGFYKAFRREFDCSPSEFTKSYKLLRPYRINILQEEEIMISKTQIRKILKNWNLENENISRIYNENTGRQKDNAVYVGKDYVLKFTANTGNIKNHIKISDALSKAGLPAANTVETTEHLQFIQNGELYFMLTKRLKGSPLRCADLFENTAPAYKIGVAVANLHNALKSFDTKPYHNTNLLNHTIGILPEVKNKINLSKSFCDEYEQKFSALYDDLPRQMIHRDINPSNILFDNGEVSGFVDFDLTEVNIRIFDVCYCATAILSETYNNKNLDKKVWYDIFTCLVDGYDSIVHLTEKEKDALPYVIYSIELICIAYFSRFDKYEELAKINTDMLCFLSENVFN